MRIRGEGEEKRREGEKKIRRAREGEPKNRLGREREEWRESGLIR